MANIIPNLNQIRDGANFLADIIRKAFEAIQSRIPWQKDDIGSVYGTVIDETGWVLDPDSIPWNSAPAGTAAGATFINCLDVYRDGIAQYRDDDSLYFGPGHLLHRGLFKRQECNDDGSWVSAVAATLTIPAECPTSPGTTSGLEPDSWYYVYWKLDAAGDGPEYRVSLVPPVRCGGYGPEHPTYEKLRFVGSFRTTAAPDASIRPFHRHGNGAVFWRDIVVGPESPDFPLGIGTTGTFVDVPDLEDWAPPTADFVYFNYDEPGAKEFVIRMKGDVAARSGVEFEDEGEDVYFGLPVGANDPITGVPATQATLEYLNNGSGGSQLAVYGYHEALL